MENPTNNMLGLNLNVDPNFIGEAVKNTILGGIIKGLDSKDEIIKNFVALVMTQKVDENGKPTDSYRAKCTLLEYFTKKVIEDVAREELLALISEKKEDIRKIMKKELAKKANIDRFCDAFISEVKAATSNTWCPKISVEFKEKENY